MMLRVVVASLLGLNEKTKEKLAIRASADKSHPFVNTTWNPAADDPPPGMLDQALSSSEEAIKKHAGAEYQHLKPYVKWILLRYSQSAINKWEDVSSRTVPALLVFDRLKRKNKLLPQEKDVNRLKGLEDLEDLTEKYEESDTSSGSERDKEIEEEFYENNKATLIYDSPKLKIVRPLTKAASCFFGKGTRWCTAATKGENKFSDYKEVGLYVLDFKKPGPLGKIQMIGNLTEIMDSKDRSVNWTSKLLPPDAYKPLMEDIFANTKNGRLAQETWFVVAPDKYKEITKDLCIASRYSMGPFILNDMRWHQRNLNLKDMNVTIEKWRDVIFGRGSHLVDCRFHLKGDGSTIILDEGVKVRNLLCTKKKKDKYGDYSVCFRFRSPLARVDGMENIRVQSSISVGVEVNSTKMDRKLLHKFVRGIVRKMSAISFNTSISGREQPSVGTISIRGKTKGGFFTLF